MTRYNFEVVVEKTSTGRGRERTSKTTWYYSFVGDDVEKVRKRVTRKARESCEEKLNKREDLNDIDVLEVNLLEEVE